MPETPTTHSSSAVAYEQPTASATTSVVVPSQPGTINRSYLEWDSWVFIVGGVLVLLTGFKQILDLVTKVVDIFDRRKKIVKEDDEPLLARIADLEETVKGFRTKEDLADEFGALSRKFEHDKDNRKLIQEGNDVKFERIIDQQTATALKVATLESDVEAIHANTERMESSITSMRERMDDRFDRLQDLITNNLTK